jgi:hypothetical protein
MRRQRVCNRALEPRRATQDRTEAFWTCLFEWSAAERV